MRHGRGSAEDAPAFVAFFRDFADRWHHGREDDVLFAALASEAGLPDARGPLGVLRDDHRRLRSAFDEIAPLLVAAADDSSRAPALEAIASAWSHALWLHIDAERSVLFPEAARRLAQAGIFELDERAPTDAERAARDLAVDLLERYPPKSDAGVVRGDGCAVCPAFGSRCEGVEREWWSDDEWDEFPDHVG